MPREKDFKHTLCADIDGFRLHAAVRCGAHDRQALEQLCRHIARPALANERVQTNAAGQVVLKQQNIDNLYWSCNDRNSCPGSQTLTYQNLYVIFTLVRHTLISITHEVIHDQNNLCLRRHR